MKYKSYLVDNKFVTGSVINWEITSNGEYVFGTKGGNAYFIKRSMHLRAPSSSDSPEVRNMKRASISSAEKKQNDIRKRLKPFSVKTDHIVAEEENFVDEELRFTTVSLLIPNCYKKDYDYKSVFNPSKDIKKFMALAKEASQIIKKIHSVGVIHGDLKEDNMIISQSSNLPNLIDFDTAYLADQIPLPENIGGTEGYQAPEVVLYFINEDESLSNTITTKVDVFSLAVVLHRWGSGDFPGFGSDASSLAEAAYSNKKLILNKVFNFKIGPKCGATIISLLNWMLQGDYNKRPSSEEVFKVLNDEIEVPSAYVVGDDEAPISLKLWPEHNNIISLVEKKIRDEYVSFKACSDGTGYKSKKYKVKTKSGSEKFLTMEDLISQGLAVISGVNVCDPWPSHDVNFVTPDEMLKLGFKSISRHPYYNGKYAYETTDGLQYVKGIEYAISCGLAKKVARDVNVDTPWPEDGSSYNQDALNMMKVKSISRIIDGGEHRYKIEYYDKATQNSVAASNLKIMGFIKK